jgi:hypothetical protein
MIRAQTILIWLAAGAIGSIGLTVAIGPRSASGADGLNACGCREGAPGQCICEKKSRCGCPGECEPKGCDERRAKQMEKEIQAETRKAEESNRRQRARQTEGDETPASTKDGDRDRERQVAPPRAPAPVRIVRMTPAQKRDLARLIAAYLAEHPDQGNKAIDQVQTEMKRN